MIPNQYRNFIIKIIEETENGNANWKLSTRSQFTLATNKATITVGYYNDDDREHSIYKFTYRNISDRKETGFQVNSDDSEWDFMDTLYTVAAASANNIESELQNFLHDLNTD